MWNVINKINKGWTFLSIVCLALNYFNLIPYYQIKFIKKNSVIPITNLFPGQKIQLSYDAVNYLDSSGVKEVEWQIITKNNKPFVSHELHPVIILPPSDTATGIYNLSVKLSTQDQGIIQGRSNIYVVQQKPVIVIITKDKTFKLNKIRTGNKQASFSHSNEEEVEIYSGHNTWIKKKIYSSDKENYFTLNQGDKTTPIDNKLIIRSSTNPDELKYYDALPMGNDRK